MTATPEPGDTPAAMFVPVVVDPQPQAPPPELEAVGPELGLIEIIFQHRSARVRVAPGFDAPTLSRVLDVLEARAC